MITQYSVLVTGGSGLLGSYLRKILNEAYFPSSSEFDITNRRTMECYIRNKNISTILHAAAFTSPPRVDENTTKAIDVNIIGTANVVKICSKFAIRLVYISTDYVFKGDKGNYREDDPVLPQNKYAWSKLGGECAVRLYDRSLIVRTSFGPETFPYDKAFVDQWTSRESVSKIALLLVNLIKKEDLFGVIHIGGKRKTVMEYAKTVSPDAKIGELSIDEVGFSVPQDTSLDIGKYLGIFGE